MRKILGLFCILALAFGSLAAFAQLQEASTQSRLVMKGPDNHVFAAYKAQNHLTPALNNLIKQQQKGAAFHNCTGFISIPCFNSWFITGYRNSVYTYSMVGHSPRAGGMTFIPNTVIPVVLNLNAPSCGGTCYAFDPSVANGPMDNNLSDVQLETQGPIWTSATYNPGGGAGFHSDTGQFSDTTLRASFGQPTNGWHTPLSAPAFGASFTGNLTWNANFQLADWVCFGGETPPCTSFPVVNINTIANVVFPGALAADISVSTLVPILITDFLTAYDPSNGGCCILGFHSANPGPEGGNAVQVWTWATFIPHGPTHGFTNPFFPFGQDSFVMSHEVTELYHDPFVQTTGTLVSPWIDGSVSFAQANLETGDVVEAMADVDSDWPVPLTTTNGPYTYHTQTEATLQWFTRNPQAPQTGPGPAVYSWPRKATLNNGHPCPSQTFVYGEGPAGFFFDDGSGTGQCH
jgi:hypothetical protein